MIIEAIIWKYGYKQGLTLVDNNIHEWPYAEHQPTREKIDAVLEEYKRHLAALPQESKGAL